ncbi:hypothetical protein A2368_01810 [Candidatus Collierbacteria bacterium RIFOXYB1_FULL_49_13]|uniref:Uncharacterized protein n=1 Tax=Candidatus Collierbacteria bacterium RIFOXYB1_FULL_49_13 TaxID=1817728 RepID=A0A1F5FIH3_9BACT|nr:MAG: hypothetical protein A2368_01810 [Candidatus Collierbacteria bacterium RIFOXYB1_FULL_49_13]
MSDLGGQVKQSFGDALDAVSTDVVKGLGSAAKDVAKGTFETVVGGGSTPNAVGQQQSGDLKQNRPDELEMLKQKKDREARQRIAELQGQLRSLMTKEQREKVETEEKEEQEKKQLEWQKSQRQRQQDEAIARAQKGGGTGEIGKTQF